VSAYQKQGDKAPPQENHTGSKTCAEDVLNELPGRRMDMIKGRGESTLEREMRDPAFRAAFEKESAALEVSEFLAKQMAEQGISVRALAQRACASATVVQGIKSGRRKNIEYTTLKALTFALDYQIMFKRTTASRA
jgi:DNA-binding Xre family transcriptional regulator